MSTLASSILTAVVSSSVMAAVLGFAFHRRNKQIEADIALQKEEIAAILSSQRKWKEQSVSELLGPVFLQLDRTRRAFDRWHSKNLYLEAKVIREGNLAIRDLLLQKGHLIPPDLLEDAGKLVEHYDRWLEEFDRLRSSENPDLQTPFTFVGPEGYPFPAESDRRFRRSFHDLWAELYGPRN